MPGRDELSEGSRVNCPPVRRKNVNGLSGGKLSSEIRRDASAEMIQDTNPRCEREEHGRIRCPRLRFGLVLAIWQGSDAMFYRVKGQKLGLLRC
jgi:hypothetical protein